MPPPIPLLNYSYELVRSCANPGRFFPYDAIVRESRIANSVRLVVLCAVHGEGTPTTASALLTNGKIHILSIFYAHSILQCGEIGG